ncbi:unnamed protein product [Hymenolepis diminuta]|uniref:Uncharacterized protein n=1 Tax=Hymenolepis diminuta TaxID=6216 RepID=A0A0R3SMP4_HYMDI|nr:unnamed protein product [Hymenolepis diminuta]
MMLKISRRSWKKMATKFGRMMYGMSQGGEWEDKRDVEEMHMEVEYSTTGTSDPVDPCVHSLPMRQCPDCVNDLWPTELPCALEPTLKWVFHRTRWPVRFSPQQKVDLSMDGINIPPWRASSTLMLSDIYHFTSVSSSEPDAVQ